jgi:hypothetical protein
MMEETEEGYSRSISLLSQILNLCNDHPDLVPVAQSRLKQLISELDGQPEPWRGDKPYVEMVILNHIKEMKKTRGIKVEFSVAKLRLMAQLLAKNHNLDLKLVCAKDIYAWLETHWPRFSAEFFAMLDGDAAQMTAV